jgi:hypothetical protein
MPQHSKGARLWLRPARGGEKTSTYIIRDGDRQIRTGFSAAQLVEAQKVLADHIAASYQPDRSSRAPSQVRILDVLHIYSHDVAPKHVRPHETAARLERLADYWGDKSLSAVNGRSCRAYAEHVGKPQAARRDLEDFRAAILHHRREGFCSEIVEVVLPEKSPARERWLTRSEAAKLLWAAWRGGQGKRKHVARFILVGLYPGPEPARYVARRWSRRPVVVTSTLSEGSSTARRPAPSRPRSASLPFGCPLDYSHMRRWKRTGASRKAVVEWHGESVLRVSKAFRGAARAAGLDGVSPHALRHTAITWAMQNGADLYDAASMFGVTVQVLESVYAHHSPNAGASVSRAIERRNETVRETVRKVGLVRGGGPLSL